MVVPQRVQITGWRLVWYCCLTLSFDSQALVHSSATAAIQFYHIGCVCHEICCQHREAQAEPTTTNNQLGCVAQRYIWRSAGWMPGRLIHCNIAGTILWEGPYVPPSFCMSKTTCRGIFIVCRNHSPGDIYFEMMKSFWRQDILIAYDGSRFFNVRAVKKRKQLNSEPFSVEPTFPKLQHISVYFGIVYNLEIYFSILLDRNHQCSDSRREVSGQTRPHIAHHADWSHEV